MEHKLLLIDDGGVNLNHRDVHHVDVIQARDTQSLKQGLGVGHLDLIVLSWSLRQLACKLLSPWLRIKLDNQQTPIVVINNPVQSPPLSLPTQLPVEYLGQEYCDADLIQKLNGAAFDKEQSLRGSIELNGLKIDFITHRVTADGQFCHLGPTEFRLLEFFMLTPEMAHSRTDLLSQVWGGESDVDERTVDAYIRRLRRALSGSKQVKYIQTVRGIGYRFSVMV